MAITTSPIALLQMEKSGPLGRLMAAGERLSNLAYHIATNRAEVDDRLRRELDECRRAWDTAAGEYAAGLREAADASPAKEERYPLLWERGETLRSVPIDLARRAYEAYAQMFGTEQSFERMRERGGFSPGEMDMFVPGWRNDPRVSEPDASPKEPR
jgi:hypothetical protein